MARQLFYGKLADASPVGNGSNSYIRVRFDATTSSTTLTNVTDVSGYFGLDKVRVGQVLVESSAFPSGTIITAVDVGNNTITVEDNPATAESQGLGRISPPQGEYFIPSASLTDPQGLVTFNNITGSDDSDYDSTDGVTYALLGPAADSGQNLIAGRFHKYTISEVFYRNASGGEGSIYIKWGEKGVESDSGDEMYTAASQTFAIVGLTPSESLAPMFSRNLSGIQELNTGQEFAAFQIEVQDFLDDIVTTDVFYTGSNVASNIENLYFTGNGVSVTSTGSRGVEINITSGGGGSTDTGSLLTTASSALNVITFTKGDASTFTITVDTGSSGDLFPFTGSAIISGSLEVIGFTNLTGSVFIEGTSGSDAFAVSDSSSVKRFSINNEGVAVLAEFANEPTAVEGGMYYSASQFFFGVE